MIFSGINTSRMRSWILSYLRRHHHITFVDFNQCSLRQYCSYSWNGYFAGRSQSLSAKLRTKVHESYKQNNASRLVQLPRCSRIIFLQRKWKFSIFFSCKMYMHLLCVMRSTSSKSREFKILIDIFLLFLWEKIFKSTVIWKVSSWGQMQIFE